MRPLPQTVAAAKADVQILVKTSQPAPAATANYLKSPVKVSPTRRTYTNDKRPPVNIVTFTRRRHPLLPMLPFS
jgi:hypothetical protein